MGRNVFAYALGHGLAGGLDAYGEGLQREQQFEQQRQLQKERFDEMQQMRGGAGYGAGGTATQRGPAIPAMTPESAVAGANTMNAVTDQELIDGGFVPPNANRALPSGYTQSPVMDPRDAATRVTYGPDGKPVTEAPKMVLDRSDPFVMEGIARLKNYRERMLHGAASDDVAKAQATQEETLRSGRVEREMGPAAAQLVGKGKGPYEGDSNVTRNILTGATANTKVGDSNVRENDAQAGKARAEGQDVGAKRKSSAGTEERLVAAEERRQASDLRADIKDVRDRIERTKRSDPERVKLEAELKALEAEQTRLRAGKAAPAGVTRIGNSSVKSLGN